MERSVDFSSTIIDFSKFYEKVGVISFLSLENITLFTEIWTRKVELWIISLMEKDHKKTFLVQISV